MLENGPTAWQVGWTALSIGGALIMLAVELHPAWSTPQVAQRVALLAFAAFAVGTSVILYSYLPAIRNRAGIVGAVGSIVGAAGVLTALFGFIVKSPPGYSGFPIDVDVDVAGKMGEMHPIQAGNHYPKPGLLLSFGNVTVINSNEHRRAVASFQLRLKRGDGQQPDPMKIAPFGGPLPKSSSIADRLNRTETVGPADSISGDMVFYLQDSVLRGAGWETDIDKITSGAEDDVQRIFDNATLYVEDRVSGMSREFSWRDLIGRNGG